MRGKKRANTTVLGKHKGEKSIVYMQLAMSEAKRRVQKGD